MYLLLDLKKQNTEGLPKRQVKYGIRKLYCQFILLN